MPPTVTKTVSASINQNLKSFNEITEDYDFIEEKKVAGGEGFEPSQPEPESDVLPLDDPPT